jgi:methylmalonyl-CoA mutase N-terminal domain/subunit
MLDLGLDVLEDPGAQVERRHGKPAEPFRFTIASDEVEHMGGVARDHRVAGKVGQVGVNLGGDR